MHHGTQTYKHSFKACGLPLASHIYLQCITSQVALCVPHCSSHPRTTASEFASDETQRNETFILALCNIQSSLPLAGDVKACVLQHVHSCIESHVVTRWQRGEEGQVCKGMRRHKVRGRIRVTEGVMCRDGVKRMQSKYTLLFSS